MLEKLSSIYSIKIIHLNQNANFIEDIVVSLACFIIEESVKKTGQDICDICLSENEKEIYITGLMIIVICSHLARITEFFFESLAHMVLIILFPVLITRPTYVARLIDDYNEMTINKSRALQAIGNQVANFVNTGRILYIEKLGELYKLMVSHLDSR